MTGFGLTSSIAPRVAARVAAEAETLGYTSIWVNDAGPPQGWLRVLTACAEATAHIQLGVGVLPADQVSVNSLARMLERVGLDEGRITVAFGAGDSSRVELVRQSVLGAKARIGVRVGIGALGPRMCELGGEIADLVLLNWVGLEFLPRPLAWIEAGARRAHRGRPRVAGYVRVAMGPQAGEAIDDEVNRYWRYPAYERHFRRLAIDPRSVCIRAQDHKSLGEAMTLWISSIDEPVVRWLPESLSATELLDRARICATKL
jgi:alkanesulfonate monooxygenase SsuD/methylene tetrahydromethanopterin reductase-like flavin-dependent oxidoreductase (luciferase family)